MNLILPPGTSSSTGASIPSPSSSTAQSPQAALLPNPTGAQTAGQQGFDWHAFIKDWAIPVLLMILTGVIGFFSSVFMLSDKISENKNEITKVGTKLESITGDVGDLKNGQKDIQQIKIDIAVVKAKIESKK